MGVGALLWSFYDLQPGLLPDGIQTQHDQVFPYFIGHQLPQGLSGIILAGLMAATMSTLSSDLNSLSAVLLDDYYIKIRKNRSDKQQLNFSRLTVLVAGLLAIFLAIAMTQIKSMADAAANFVSLLAGGILAIYLLGLFCKRCSPVGIYSGLIIGILFILWTFLGNQKGNEWMMAPAINTLWVGLFGNIIVFGSGYLISRILTPRYKTLE
jgi:SSS family solute:Na+ symporter